MTAKAQFSSRGERTRQVILDAALELFAVHGYDETTMRMIAAAARTSLGNSYYYFPTKDHLVQAFYERLQDELVGACRSRLEGVHDLRERLLVVTSARLEVLAPYHAVTGALFGSAADPRSPLSPFSRESAPTREASVELWREVVEQSTARVPKDIRPALPYLLWLYDVGLVLFWIYDSSPEQTRSREFANDSVDAIVLLLAVAQLPGLRAVRARLLKWVDIYVAPKEAPRT